MSARYVAFRPSLPFCWLLSTFGVTPFVALQTSAAPSFQASATYHIPHKSSQQLHSTHISSLVAVIMKCEPLETRCELNAAAGLICVEYEYGCHHEMRLPLPSNRHHRSCGDRLEGKGENYQVCSVQYCVQQLCTVRCTHR